MKTINRKTLAIFTSLLALLLIPQITFADCTKHVFVERPKMQWYLDACGEWRQGYPYDDTGAQKVSTTVYDDYVNFDYDY
jgi:hypothetical protein